LSDTAKETDGETPQVKNTDYWDNIRGGMWIRDNQVILFVDDDTTHVYQLPVKGRTVPAETVTQE